MAQTKRARVRSLTFVEEKMIYESFDITLFMRL